MSEKHNCRWPGCTKQVPLNMWGCKSHWFQLPKEIRDRIWAAYRPGQEDDLSPSGEWCEADDAARNYGSQVASLQRES